VGPPLPVTVLLYGVPTVAFGSVAGLTVIPCALTAPINIGDNAIKPMTISRTNKMRQIAKSQPMANRVRKAPDSFGFLHAIVNDHGEQSVKWLMSC
jgi:hypothetical protein